MGNEMRERLQDPQYVLVRDIDSSQGSRPAKYEATIKIPFFCERCTLAVLDQRMWGGCIDMKVEGTLPPTPAPPTMEPLGPNKCGNAVIEAANDEECEPTIDQCCRADCKFDTLVPGCPCVDYACDG